MDLSAAAISELRSRFPEGFEFYHLGEVRPLEEASSASTALINDLIDQQAIVYRIEGAELRAVAVLTVDAGLDPSIYSEMGNVIMSRLADRVDAMISPPVPLSGTRLEAMFKSGAPALSQVYVHLHQGHAVKVRISLFATEEIAHA